MDAPGDPEPAGDDRTDQDDRSDPTDQTDQMAQTDRIDWFRTRPDRRNRPDQPTRAYLRRGDRLSRRAGVLSPLTYNLTISHTARFVWFRVAKAATRSVFGHLQAAGVPLDVDHAMRIRYPTAAFADYYKFAFVRHPLDRFLSTWRNKVVDANYYHFDDDDLAALRASPLAFAEWAAGHDLGDNDATDQHLILQSRAIDLTQVQFLGRQETFDRDFGRVCAVLGLPRLTTERRNQSSAPTAPPPAGLAARVESMYALDYDIFGYTRS